MLARTYKTTPPMVLNAEMAGRNPQQLKVTLLATTPRLKSCSLGVLCTLYDALLRFAFQLMLTRDVLTCACVLARVTFVAKTGHTSSAVFLTLICRGIARQHSLDRVVVSERLACSLTISQLSICDREHLLRLEVQIHYNTGWARLFKQFF